ncbi:hypothetical protein TNCV_2602761 [Trichonephila clavipes]|nr:hypothetical protein TNCV_2602761 [Trichonephila clavipes]
MANCLQQSVFHKAQNYSRKEGIPRREGMHLIGVPIEDTVFFLKQRLQVTYLSPLKQWKKGIATRGGESQCSVIIPSSYPIIFVPRCWVWGRVCNSLFYGKIFDPIKMIQIMILLRQSQERGKRSGLKTETLIESTPRLLVSELIVTATPPDQMRTRLSHWPVVSIPP